MYRVAAALPAVILECSEPKVILRLHIFIAPIQAAMVSISLCYGPANLVSTVNASSISLAVWSAEIWNRISSSPRGTTG
jgi:hypothetical protein